MEMKDYIKRNVKVFQLVDSGIPLGHFQRYDDALKAVCIRGSGIVRKLYKE